MANACMHVRLLKFFTLGNVGEGANEEPGSKYSRSRLPTVCFLRWQGREPLFLRPQLRLSIIFISSSFLLAREDVGQKGSKRDAVRGHRRMCNVV